MSVSLSPRGNRNSTAFCCECGFRISGLNAADDRPFSRVRVSRRNPFSMALKCADCEENWGEAPGWR